MKGYTFLVSLVALFSTNFSAAAHAEVSCKNMTLEELASIEMIYKKIDEQDRKETERLSDEEFILKGTDKRHLVYQEIYSKCLAPQLGKLTDLDDLSVEQLSNLFEAISHTQFYTSSPQQSSVMLKLFKALERKEEFEQGKLIILASKMYHAFLRSRQFEELNRLAAQYEGLEKISFVQAKGKSQRNILRQKVAEATFYQEPYDLSNKTQVIVVSNPYCHFSKDARNYLSESEKYRGIFSEHATWIIPADANLYFDGVYEDPQQDIFPFVYTYRANEWPEIDYWGTPAFYFYEDGVLKYKVIGWSKGREKYIEQGLKEIGLL